MANKASSYREAFELSSKAIDLETALGAAPCCRECQEVRPAFQTTQRPLNNGDQSRGLSGLIARLPMEENVRMDSIIRTQASVNSGAYNHPCVILLEAPCRHLVFVAPVTSFGQTTIQDKYSRAGSAARSRIFWEYLAIRQRRPTANTPATAPHNSLPVLELDNAANTPDLPKQSYVHLDVGFWIEWCSLAVHGDGSGRRLSPASLDDLRWAYAVTESHRRSGGQGISTLISRTPSPPLCPAAPVVPVVPAWRVTAGPELSWRDGCGASLSSEGAWTRRHQRRQQDQQLRSLQSVNWRSQHPGVGVGGMGMPAEEEERKGG